MPEPNFGNNTHNPRGRPRGHGISWHIAKILDEEIPNVADRGMIAKKEVIARKLVDIALSPDTPIKDFLQLSSEIMDRLEGKPIQRNLNEEIPYNPFEEISTEKLENLKVRLADNLKEKIIEIPNENVEKNPEEKK
jgi:hypothetical protein